MDTDMERASRLLSSDAIIIKAPIPQDPCRTTIFRLPAELRNMIYDLVLEPSRELCPAWNEIPCNRNRNYALLETSTMIHWEVRGILINTTTVYIPISAGWINMPQDSNDSNSSQQMRFLNSPNAEPSPPNENISTSEDTFTRALSDFMNVHFRLHRDAIADFLPSTAATLLPIKHVLSKFMTHSQKVSKAHSWRRRRAILHLDDFVTSWTRQKYPIGFYNDLVAFIAQDINTFWEIRFRVNTGTNSELDDYPLKEHDMMYLKGLCRRHEHVSVVAEVYGDVRWGMEDELRGEVTREITEVPGYYAPVVRNGG